MSEVTLCPRNFRLSCLIVGRTLKRLHQKDERKTGGKETEITLVSYPWENWNIKEQKMGYVRPKKHFVSGESVAVGWCPWP